MSGCDPGGAHEVAIAVQDIDPFFQLPVPHQDHVADIGAGWREKGAGVRGQDGIPLGRTPGLYLCPRLPSPSNEVLNRCQACVQVQWGKVWSWCVSAW